MPLADVSTDFNGNPRSTTVAGGPVDIGAYEFSTATTPPAAIQGGIIGNNETSTYNVFEFESASITGVQVYFHPELPLDIIQVLNLRVLIIIRASVIGISRKPAAAVLVMILLSITTKHKSEQLQVRMISVLLNRLIMVQAGHHSLTREQIQININ